MSPKTDKPKPEPVPLFVRRMRSIAESIEMMEKPELLGNIEAIRPQLTEVKNQVAALVAYADQYEAACIIIDEQLKGATASTTGPLQQNKQDLTDAAAAHYQRQAARLVQTIRQFCDDILLAEYGVEVQKLAGVITSSEQTDTARTNLRRSLTETDDVIPPPGDEMKELQDIIPPPRDKMTQDELQELLTFREGLFSMDGVLGTYQIFSPKHEVLERASDIEKEFHRAVILMNADFVLNTVAKHAMQAFEAIRDIKLKDKRAM